MSAKEQMELDKFCAEKVMGWLTHENWWLNEEGEAERTISNWNPTTNDADAMAVWKACLAKVSCREIRQYQSTEEDGSKVFCIYLEGRREVIMAPTLPEAICLFSKKLHGG